MAPFCVRKNMQMNIVREEVYIYICLSCEKLKCKW